MFDYQELLNLLSAGFVVTLAVESSIAIDIQRFHSSLWIWKQV